MGRDAMRYKSIDSGNDLFAQVKNFIAPEITQQVPAGEHSTGFGASRFGGEPNLMESR